MKFTNYKTHTEPVHLHVPGSRPERNRVRREWLAQYMELIDHKWQPLKVNVVTWSTHEPLSTIFEESCVRWGFQPYLARRILGAESFKLTEKIGMALVILQQANRLLPHPYTIFSDADDAIFLRHPNDMLPRLEQLKAGAIISANSLNWPRDSPVASQTGLYPYGNSGGIAGLNVKLEAMFAQALKEKLPPSGRGVDQALVRQAAHKLGIPIDSNAELFQIIKPETKHHLKYG